MINYKEALPEEFHFKVMQKWNGKKMLKKKKEKKYIKKFPTVCCWIQGQSPRSQYMKTMKMLVVVRI